LSNDRTRERAVVQSDDPLDKKIRYLSAILRRAIDADALKALMQDIGFQRSIVNVKADQMAQFFAFRHAVIDGQAYILCPVPFFYDEDRHIESGFAVDVDRDQFSVYAYMHDHSTGESVVISRLPHCVYRAITLDAEGYSVIGDEVKELSNEASAIFFINSLIADLTVNAASPITFFDDQLYLQLIDRLLSIKDTKWINLVVVGKKLDQLLRQLDALDAGDPFYANNKRRIFMNIVNLVWGSTGIHSRGDLMKHIKPAILQQHAGTLGAYLATLEFWKFLHAELKQFSRDKAKVLLGLLETARIENLAEFSEICFDYCFKHRQVSHADILLDLIPHMNEQARQEKAEQLYKDLFRAGSIEDAMALSLSSGTRPAPDLLQHPETVALVKGYCIEQIQWGLDPLPIARLMEAWGIWLGGAFADDTYFTLLDCGRIAGAVAFSMLTGTRPRADMLRDPLIAANLEYFLKSAGTTKPGADAAKRVMEWMQPRP